MVQKHAWARVPHNRFYFFSHLRLIIMYQTHAACSFLFLERASIQTHLCILQKFITFWAKLTLAFMMLIAVYAHHCFNGLFLSPNPRMLNIHLKVRSYLLKKMIKHSNKPSQLKLDVTYSISAILFWELLN